MKKILAIILTAILCASLVACGSQSTSNESKNTNSNTNTGNVVEETTPSQQEQVVSEDKKQGDLPSSIEETVIYDKDGVKVTAKEIDHSGFMGPEIKMLFENNSSKDVTIQTRNCVINGYMINTMMSVDVAAGKKANDGLTLMESDLQEAGIGKFIDISFDLAIIDTTSFTTIDETDLISLDTNYTGKYNQKHDDNGTVIYDANNIKVVSKGIEADDVFGQSLNLYIENNSDKAVVIQSDSASVNGFMISTMFSSTVLPSAKIVDDMTFLGSSLEENSITNIENIEVKIIVIDQETFSRIDESEPITLEF